MLSTPTNLLNIHSNVRTRPSRSRLFFARTHLHAIKKEEVKSRVVQNVVILRCACVTILERTRIITTIVIVVIVLSVVLSVALLLLLPRRPPQPPKDGARLPHDLARRKVQLIVADVVVVPGRRRRRLREPPGTA